MEYLECIFCKKTYPLDLFNTLCPDCREPLLFHLHEKKKNLSLNKPNPLEKFLDFLPLSKVQQSLLLGEGNTPLMRLNRLIKKYELPSIFAKNESSNPTSSFKDRGTSVAVQKAVSSGIDKIGTVSTGNMASSTAAYGAKAGLRTFILVKEDVSYEKLVSAAVYNPVLIKVQGDYGDLFYKSLSLGKKYSIYFMNSIDPFRVEGYKTIGFEIFFQLKKQIPQYIFTPVSSGGNIIGLMKAFLDLKHQGFIQQLPTFIGVQAEGCAPIANAFALKKRKVQRIKQKETVAQAISNPNPPGGNIALKMICNNGGMIIDVSDKEILLAQKILAELEGIFCLPASATTLAGFFKLSKRIKFDSKDRIILIITGSGLKGIKNFDCSKMNIQNSTLLKLDETISSILT